MGLLGEAGGIKYEDLGDDFQDVVDQKADSYEDLNVEVVDELEYGGEVHENVAVAYVGEGTVPQVAYENADLTDDDSVVMRANVVAAAIDHALQEFEGDADNYVVAEADTGDIISEEVERLRPLGAVREASSYISGQEFNDRFEQHMSEMDEALESPEAQEFVREAYRDVIDSASEDQDAVAVQTEALNRLKERTESADEELVEEVENAAAQTETRIETVFADSMDDYATVSMPERMNF